MGPFAQTPANATEETISNSRRLCGSRPISIQLKRTALSTSSLITGSGPQGAVGWEREPQSGHCMFLGTGWVLLREHPFIVHTHAALRDGLGESPRRFQAPSGLPSHHDSPPGVAADSGRKILGMTNKARQRKPPRLASRPRDVSSQPRSVGSTLEDLLARFDPQLHGGEVMAWPPIGVEVPP